MMLHSFRDKTTDIIRGVVNRAASPLGLEVSRKHEHDWSDVANFIPFEETVEAAEKAGLSVGDYIDGVMNRIPGATQATMDQIAALGVFAGRIETVVEIGPGSGRYLEKTLDRCHPTRYEFYETAGPWAAYVAAKYGAIRQPTNGEALAATLSNSVDLIQAHKVFNTITFIATSRYWVEMARVTRVGGFAVFDILTEACLVGDMLERWVASRGRDHGSYPSIVPRAVAVGFFERSGFSLVGRFFAPMGPGNTEVYVFRRDATMAIAPS